LCARQIHREAGGIGGERYKRQQVGRAAGIVKMRWRRRRPGNTAVVWCKVLPGRQPKVRGCGHKSARNVPKVYHIVTPRKQAGNDQSETTLGASFAAFIATASEE